MEYLQGIFVDSLNGFSIQFIPLFLFQLLVAGILCYLITYLIRKKWDEEVIINSVLIGVGITLITSIVKYSLPFSVMGAAVILLLIRTQKYSQTQVLNLLFVGIIGVGCGVGSVIQTIIGFGLIFLIIFFTPLKK